VDEGPLGAAATARLLERHGVRPRKALGQHFLVDPNVTRKIVAVAGVGPGDSVVEVGAGAGTLTRALAAGGARVVSYEVDERLRPLLAEALSGTDVEVRFADAARLHLDSVLDGDGWVLVSNLPYNVGTPLLLDQLREGKAIDRFVVMLQREAVERLAAEPGSRAYGLPSVIAQLHADVEVAFRVPPSVFLPRPDVESAVAVLRRRPPDRRAGAAVRLAAAGFGQRRKMLRRSLRVVMAEPGAVLAAAGLDPEARAEDLAPGDYLHLAEVADGD
jgi:16S rRNA (adenine1518-N6/adenine1519-N6)-dimethyltransferase